MCMAEGIGISPHDGRGLVPMAEPPAIPPAGVLENHRVCNAASASPLSDGSRAGVWMLKNRRYFGRRNQGRACREPLPAATGTMTLSRRVPDRGIVNLSATDRGMSYTVGSIVAHRGRLVLLASGSSLPDWPRLAATAFTCVFVRFDSRVLGALCPSRRSRAAALDGFSRGLDSSLDLCRR